MIASTTMRAAATCVLLATTCLSTFFVSPALAQTTDIPSAYKNIDENGVDLTDGSFNFSLVEGSIGSGEGLLSLIRYDADGSSLDNWEGLALHVEDGTVTVLLGNRSEAFADNGTGFVSEQGNGATLTGSGNSFTYRNADGTQIMFGKADGQTDPCASNANCSLVALSVQEPGGKTVSLQWQALGANVCLTRVSNNFRYAMDVAYLEGGIVNGQATPDWHKRATVTFRNDTVFSGPTPTTRYAYPSANVTEVTTTGERKWRITTDTQGRVVGVKRPGAADDSTQVEYGANGVGKVTHEGVVTTYVRSVDGNVARTEVSDALGRRLTIWSNIATGRPTSVVDALSGLTSYSYDSNDRLTQVTAPERNKVIIEYDARGNVTKRTLKPKPLPDSTPDTTTPDIVTEARVSVVIKLVLVPSSALL